MATPDGHAVHDRHTVTAFEAGDIHRATITTDVDWDTTGLTADLYVVYALPDPTTMTTANVGLTRAPG